MTYIAIKVFNAVTLKRFHGLEERFTRAACAPVDITIIDHDDQWTYCDVEIDDGPDDLEPEEGCYDSASRLVDYIKGMDFMHEIVIDWDAMSDVASEVDE